MSDSAPGAVLFLSSSLTIGGSERKTVRVANELHRQGWDVHVAYLNPPTTLARELDSAIPVKHLQRKGKFSFIAVKRLRAYIRQARCSTVLCINLYPLIYAMAARMFLFAREKPQVIQMINTTKHASKKDRAAMLIFRPLIKRVEKVVFGCRAQLDLWCRRYGLDPEKCTFIYNGVDDTKFSPEPASENPTLDDGELLADERGFLIGSIGQLRPVKNQIELILALARMKDTLPEARLIIIGDGSERDALQLAAEQHGLSERVSFLGQVDDVRPVLGEIDLFVLPSISETFSNAALEAMAMGKAVILSDTGGAREMVQDGVTGYVYHQGDIGALADLIVGLANDSAARGEMGERARALVLRKFSFERMMDDYRRILC